MTDTKLHLVKNITLRLAEAMCRGNVMLEYLLPHADERNAPPQRYGLLSTPEDRTFLAEALADFAEKLCLAADRHRVQLTKLGGQTMHLPEEDPLEVEVARAD